MKNGNICDNRGMEKRIAEGKIEYWGIGKVQAGVYFSCKDGILRVDSTFVSPSLRGQGMGAKLMEDLLVLARRKGVRISSCCSYATHYFQTHPTPLFLE